MKKFILIFSIIFFNFHAFSVENNEKTLSIVEIAAMYHTDYINSKEGQQKFRQLEKILNTKLVFTPIKGTYYYQFSTQPKSEMTSSMVNEIKSSFPEITFVYSLDHQ